MFLLCDCDGFHAVPKWGIAGHVPDPAWGTRCSSRRVLASASCGHAVNGLDATMSSTLEASQRAFCIVAPLS